MKKLNHLPPGKVLWLARVLILAALIPLAAAWAVGEDGRSDASMAWIAALCIAAILLFAAGAAVAYVYLRCPHCGASLCSGWRLPWSLPRYCTACGKDLEKAED